MSTTSQRLTEADLDNAIRATQECREYSHAPSEPSWRVCDAIVAAGCVGAVVFAVFGSAV